MQHVTLVVVASHLNLNVMLKALCHIFFVLRLLDFIVTLQYRYFYVCWRTMFRLHFDPFPMIALSVSILLEFSLNYMQDLSLSLDSIECAFDD